MAASPEKPQLSATSLTLEDAARLLSALGKRRLSVEMIEKDVAAGAPLNADGTLNLVHYGAWLLWEAARGCD